MLKRKTSEQSEKTKDWLVIGESDKKNCILISRQWRPEYSVATSLMEGGDKPSTKMLNWNAQYKAQVFSKGEGQIKTHSEIKAGRMWCR